ncbi:MAG: zinc ribbon domain-containing protein, partial [Clostridia bacterium]|nr:zinc ribbon domain-containing protein [Clostridia bacterium]
MYCEKCGAQLGSCALFCNNCGAGVTQNVENEGKNTDVAVETVAISVASKSNTAKNVMLIVRNSLIMLLAAVMLAFSFLPVISVGTDYSGADVKMHLSPIDSIRITIDSFFEYSSPDESHVYGYISELSEELSDEIGTTVKDKEILKKYENEISRCAVLTLRLQLSLEGMRAPISFYCAAILSLLYMLLTVAFFVFSIFNLLSTFSIIRMGKRSLGWFNSIFAATPVFMIALFFVMGVSYSAAVTVSLTGWAIAA